MIEGAQTSPNKAPGPWVFSTAAKLQRATDLSSTHPGLIRKEPRTHEKKLTQRTAGALASHFSAGGNEAELRRCLVKYAKMCQVASWSSKK